MVSRRDSWILFKLDTRDTMYPVDVFVSNQEICFLPVSFPVPILTPSLSGKRNLSEQRIKIYKNATNNNQKKKKRGYSKACCTLTPSTKSKHKMTNFQIYWAEQMPQKHVAEHFCRFRPIFPIHILFCRTPFFPHPPSGIFWPLTDKGAVAVAVAVWLSAWHHKTFYSPVKMQMRKHHYYYCHYRYSCTALHFANFSSLQLLTGSPC